MRRVIAFLLPLLACQAPEVEKETAVTTSARPAILTAATYMRYDTHGNPAVSFEIAPIDDTRGTLTLFDYGQYNYSHDVARARTVLAIEVVGERTKTGIEIVRGTGGSCITYRLTADGQTLYRGDESTSEQDPNAADTGCAQMLDFTHTYVRIL